MASEKNSTTTTDGGDVDVSRAVHGFRGAPQLLPMLSLLGRATSDIHRRLGGAAPDPVALVCSGLSSGAAAVAVAVAGMAPLNNNPNGGGDDNDGMDVKLRRVLASMELQPPLSFMLGGNCAGPSEEAAEEALRRSLVSDLCCNSGSDDVDGRLLVRLVVPLFLRHAAREERRRVESLNPPQRQALLKADEDRRRLATESMGRLLGLVFEALARPRTTPNTNGSRNNRSGTYPGGGGMRATAVGRVLGRLTVAAGSFRVLCSGGLVLLHRAIGELTAAADGNSNNSSKTSSGGGGGLARNTAAARVAAVDRAGALMEEWCVLFGTYGGSALYDPTARAAVLSATSADADGDDCATLTSTAAAADIGIDESQWAFLMSALSRLSSELQSLPLPRHGTTTTGASSSSLSLARNDDVDGTTAARREVVSTFIEDLQARLGRYACLHLSATLGARFTHLASSLAARNHFVPRRLFWACVDVADDGKTNSSSGGGDHISCGGEVQWGQVTQLLTRLTAAAAQGPSEDSAANSAVGLSSNSGFYLGSGESAGVLGDMGRRFRACEAATLAARCVHRSGARKRPRCQANNGHNSNNDGHGDDVGDAARARLLSYLSFSFYPLYDASCFALLRSGGQRLLPSCLEGLHELLVGLTDRINRADAHWKITKRNIKETRNNGKTTAAAVVTATHHHHHHDDEDSEDWDEEPIADDPPPSPPALRTETASTPETITAPDGDASVVVKVGESGQRALLLLRRLGEEPRLSLLLAHCGLTLLERRGKVGADVSAAFASWLLPSLVTLTCQQPDPFTNDKNDKEKEEDDDDDDDDPAHGAEWTQQQQAYFCTLLLVNSGFLLALPWNVPGIYLTLRRYNELSRQLCEEFFLSTGGGGAGCGGGGGGSPQPNDINAAARCVERLLHWVEEGGGAISRRPGTAVNAACTAVDETIARSDAFYQQATSATAIVRLSAVGGQVADDRLRAVTPLHLPPPCSLLVVVSVYKTLARQLYCLRNSYEEQRAQAQASRGTHEHFTTRPAFCTTEDARTFTVVVQLAHRMVFAHQPQALGLLRLWLSYLRHLFVSMVPPPADDEGDDTVRLLPVSRQQEQSIVNCFGETTFLTGWRAAVKTPGVRFSSQTELREALGEALADLVLSAAAAGTTTATAACNDGPPAFPLVRHSREWRRQRSRRARGQAAVAATLPVAVLETVCMLLEIDTTRTRTTKEDREALGAACGPRIEEEDRFLGLHGLVALCQQLDRSIVPGSIASPRVAHLTRCLWAVADAAALGH